MDYEGSFVDKGTDKFIDKVYSLWANGTKEAKILAYIRIYNTKENGHFYIVNDMLDGGGQTFRIYWRERRV